MKTIQISQTKLINTIQISKITIKTIQINEHYSN